MTLDITEGKLFSEGNLISGFGLNDDRGNMNGLLMTRANARHRNGW